VSGRAANETAAHRYADACWPVFPLIPGEKAPITRHGFQDATTGHRQIEKWFRDFPDRNIGVATGAPGPDVLDVDRHPDGAGFGSYNRLRAEGLVPDAAALIRTPNGGMHAYYTGTGQRSGSLPEYHIDYRARGGYVAAPPSVVWARDGQPRTYEVVSHQRSGATFDWDATRRFLQPEPEHALPQPGRPTADLGSGVEHLPDWVARQAEGNRNAALFWAANRALDRGHPDTLASLARAAKAAGLGEREIERTIRSAQRTAAQGAGFRPAEREAG
jgi:Bifunctional DNA primase/polymerase, N-terminal